MRHVIQEWVMSRVDESCLTWMRYVTHTQINYVIHQRAMASRHSCSTASFPRSLQIYLYHYLILLNLHFNVFVFYLHCNVISNLISFVLNCICIEMFYFSALLCSPKPCEACHIWMSHVTYEWVVSQMNESFHIWMSHVTYEWVMSHMNESCHIWMSRVTYEWVISHMNEACHIWMSHVTYEWVMSHMDKSRHIRMSFITYEWAMSCRNEPCHV